MLNIVENGKSISVKGTVIWAKLQGNRKAPNGDLIPLYTAGMKFTDVSSIKVKELITFIETHEHKEVSIGKITNQGNVRLNMRFCVNIYGKTVLICPDSYTVKKISMGGMLIESKTHFENEERMPMEFSLPEDSSVKFLGRVASCTSTTGDEGGYKIGIEFSNMSNEDSKKLQEFISKLNHQ
jgi:c-di-GMP-binding flagellar brake protein YcgR